MQENAYLDKIAFHSEGISFVLEEADAVKEWIIQSIEQEGHTLEGVNYIFCSDDYLYEMNMQYLQHDTLTDVITFQYGDEAVEGDIFISLDRIEDNAKDYKISFQQELSRVMIHGVLHLMGYKDKTDKEQEEMTRKENEYLALRK